VDTLDASFPLDPPLPAFAQIEPVGQCNLRCRMCPIQFRRDGPPYGPLAFMPFERFVELLDQLPGLRELHLQGLGEPTMHPRFFDMVAVAAARGMRVSTNSNLTLWSTRRARECIASGLAEISVSLDAATPAVYERIRVRAHFGKVLRNLRRLMAARAEARAALDVRIVMVLMRGNLREIEPVVRLAAAEGVTRVFVQHLCHDNDEASLPSQYRPLSAYVEEQRLDRARHAADVAASFAVARAAAADVGVELRLPRLGFDAPAPRTVPGCDWPWRGACISYSGDAMPCCMVATPDRMSFGNVFASSVDAVWRNQGYRDFRAALRSPPAPAVCRACSLYRGTF